MSELTAKQSIWMQRLSRLERWSLAEALVWIACRSERVIGEVTDFGQSACLGEPPDLMGEIIQMTARDEPTCVESEPALALEAALSTGSVRASGAFLDNPVRLIQITSEDWRRLSYPGLSGRVAREPNSLVFILPGHREVQWIDVGYSREDLMREFPAGVGRVDPGSSPAWWLRPGEQQQIWVMRAEVHEEAKRRDPASLNATKRLGETLAAMSREWGGTWSAASLRSALTREGFKPPQKG